MSIPRSARFVPYLIAAMMAAASVGAILARPTTRLADLAPSMHLARMIPTRFGDWQSVPFGGLRVVNPETEELLDRTYNELLARVYVNSSGYRIMLSVAYGQDQRGPLQAHRPEICYPAQGFTLHASRDGRVKTPFGVIPVRRLFATLRERREAITYWFLIGGIPTLGKWQPRLVTLRYGFSGIIPDGVLFRVSSLDRDKEQAYQEQDVFIDQLMRALSADDRLRLAGLGARAGH